MAAQRGAQHFHGPTMQVAGESGSEAGRLHEEKALLGEKKKPIFC